MYLRSRTAGRSWPAALTLALVTGCGGSLADVDGRAPRAEPPAAAPSEFCVATQNAADAVRPLNALLTRDAGDREELAGLIEPVRRANGELLQTAPSEIRADVERSVEASNLQLDALAARGADGLDEELRSRLETPEYTQAAERIRDHVAENC